MRITVKDKSVTTYSSIRIGSVFLHDHKLFLKSERGAAQLSTGFIYNFSGDEVVKLATSITVEVE